MESKIIKHEKIYTRNENSDGMIHYEVVLIGIMEDSEEYSKYKVMTIRYDDDEYDNANYYRTYPYEKLFSDEVKAYNSFYNQCHKRQVRINR